MDEPTEVPGLTGVRVIACGNDLSPVIRNDGTVWVWSTNRYAQFGNGKRDHVTHYELEPRPVKDVEHAFAISSSDNQSHTIALLTDGTIRVCGHNDTGNGGVGTYGVAQVLPAAPKITGVKAVFVVGNNSFAVRSDGSMWVWGAESQLVWYFTQTTPIPTKK
jgi:alpha-tubulin suppressor-like RCC1 family protein